MATPPQRPSDRPADAVARRIAAYEPRTDIDHVLWARLKQPVGDAVGAHQPRSPADAAMLMSTVAAYAVRLMDVGRWHPEDDEPLPFDPALVEHHVAQIAAEGGAASAGTIRSRLASVGRSNEPDRWPRPTPMYKSPPASMTYTAGEQQHLADGARMRLSATGDVVPLAVVAGGLGAGLRPDDFRRLAGTDLHIDGDRGQVVIADGPRPRTIEIVSTWVADLATVADRLDGHPLLDQSQKRTNRDLAWQVRNRLKAHGVPPINTHRLRNTWMVERLDAGVPLPVLMNVAGLKTANSIVALASHIAVPDTDRTVALLRKAVVR